MGYGINQEIACRIQSLILYQISVIPVCRHQLWRYSQITCSRENLSLEINCLQRQNFRRKVEADPKRAYQNHKIIIDALEARDAELVRKTTRDSLMYWKQYVSKKDK